jgi:chromosome partitioning protein
MIYAFLNQKGGMGKTTLSLHVASALARSKQRVLLIDADPQQSAMKWSTVRSGVVDFAVIGMARATLHKEIVSLGANYDHVVIDGPPRVTELARSIIIASDVVVIPVQPFPFDVWAAAETVDLIKEARIYKDNFRAVIAINRKIVNTAIGRDVREALASLGGADLGRRCLATRRLCGGGGRRSNSVGYRPRRHRCSGSDFLSSRIGEPA